MFPPIGGLLTELGGWRLSFAPYAIGLATAVLIFRRLDANRPLHPMTLRDQLGGAGTAVRHRDVLGSIAIGVIIFMLIFGLFLTALPVHLEREFGLSAGQRGLVIAAPALTSTFTALRLGWLRARFGVVALLTGASVLFAIAFVIMGVAPTLPVLLGAAMLYGLGEGMFIPTLQDVVAGASTAAQRGAVVAVWVGSARAGQTVGPLAASATYGAVGTGPTFVIGGGRRRGARGARGHRPLRSRSAAPRPVGFSFMVLQVIGGGRMGEALVGGLLTAGGQRSTGSASSSPIPIGWWPCKRPSRGSTWSTEPTAADGNVIAVKPADVATACRGAGGQRSRPGAVDRRGRHHRARSRLISRRVTRVVRAMPNTASVLGAGAAAIARGTTATDDDLAWAETLLGAVGTVVRVKEPLLDAVTGLSGSGPAYVFLVAEALIEAGVLAGLPRDVSQALSIQTILGAATLLADGDGGPEALRAAVTSPAGTTAAGLRVLEQHGVRSAFIEAVVAATERSTPARTPATTLPLATPATGAYASATPLERGAFLGNVITASSVPHTERGRRAASGLEHDRLPPHQVGRPARGPHRQVVPHQRGRRRRLPADPLQRRGLGPEPDVAGTLARAMGARFDTITFLSDYGTTDEFVGVVKSVIRSIAREVTVIDLTHEIQAYDVRAGSLTLGRAAQYLCPGVVLAVVDPGVGSERRAIAVEVGGGQSYLVGPDNGLLAGAVAMSGGATAAVELTNPDFQLVAPGPTFAGRDVFGPAAAHLCAGVPLADLGRPIDPLSLVPGLLPLSREEDGDVVAEVLWVDRYGNCQLNVDPEEVAAFGPRVQLRWGDDVRIADRAATYEGIVPGQVGLVVDSYGMLSVCMGKRSAADELALPLGTEITLSAPGDDTAPMTSSPVTMTTKADR